MTKNQTNIRQSLLKLGFFSCLLSFSNLFARDVEEECMQPWIFFDLGNTIVDTKTNDYKPMFYMEDVSKKIDDVFTWKDGPLYKNAKSYVDHLNDEKITMGMLIDIPEKWGVNYPEANPILDIPTAKIVRTLNFLAGLHGEEDNASWRKEEGDVAFDYLPFGKFSGLPANAALEGSSLKFEGRLLLPQNNTERKKVNGLPNSHILFERAVALAKEKNCKAIYQGEDTDEMQLAEEAGMIPFNAGTTSKNYFYLPLSKIKWYAENYKEGMWKGLGEADFE